MITEHWTLFVCKTCFYEEVKQSSNETICPHCGTRMTKHIHLGILEIVGVSGFLAKKEVRKFKKGALIFYKVVESDGKKIIRKFLYHIRELKEKVQFT